MGTPFSEIYNLFTSLITDPDLIEKLNAEETEETLFVYMKMTIALDFKRCKKNLSDIDLNLKQFNETLDEEEKSIIAIGMIKYWLSSKIAHDEKLKNRLGDRDYKVSCSEANLLDKMIDLKKSVSYDLKSYLNSYHYNNFKGYGNR